VGADLSSPTSDILCDRVEEADTVMIEDWSSAGDIIDAKFGQIFKSLGLGSAF
jgi:hypothetical protein